MYPSISEDRGLKNLKDTDKNIYSVGISTGGSAEIKMANKDSERKIIATTIDKKGASFGKNRFKKNGLSNQIEVRIEDISQPLPYENEFFDFIYARLVLHYLSKQDLEKALSELHRVLKPSGKIFVVVKAKNLSGKHDNIVNIDPITGMTTKMLDGKEYKRFLHTKDSIQEFLLLAGFKIEKISTYKEQLCKDFQRKILSEKKDFLIEVVAVK